MRQFITFDIGGTNIKYGIINENGQLMKQFSTPTEAHLGGDAILDKIINIANELKENASGICISSAGIINPISGIVEYATDAIPNYIGLKIKKRIEQETGLTTEVQNDVNCFAICEATIGNGVNAKNFITLTVGTGIGGAIYINNQLYMGHHFSAGEWGRMHVIDQKFENVASITGLIQLANHYIEERAWTGKKIFQLYDEGHKGAISVVNIFYHYLATGIMNLIYTFNPEKVIIGGGISTRGSQFINELYHHIEKIIEPIFLKATKIELAKYYNNSGMIGACFHFLDAEKKRKL